MEAAAVSIGAGSEGRVEEWALAHEALSKLRLKRAGLDAEEGAWLLRAFRAATHAHFGYASFGEYIERLFGLRRRAIEEKLRVAEALEELPELTGALRSGELNWSAVRELSRVAVPETEREWIAVARQRTAREVERMVSGLAPGNRPADRRRPELVRHVLRFEVGAETLAAFREAMTAVQKRGDHRLDDDAVLFSMAREILGGPRDSGRASYQVVVTQCEDCGRGYQHANGELIQLDPSILEMCHCDAQQVTIPRASRCGEVQSANTDNVGAAGARAVSDTRVGAAGARAVSDTHVGAAGARAVSDTRVGAADAKAVSDTRVGAAGARAVSDTHVGAAGAKAVSDVHLSGAVAVREAHVGAADGVAASNSRVGARERLKGARATQNIPPAVRRQVFLRDRGRCVVPGCRNAAYVDLHHLDLRSEGGSDDPDNLVVLCGAHHGAAHRGRLRIDGKVSTGVRVRHADGTTYGLMPSATLADASAKAFAALRNLSYPEKTARAAVERTLASAPANASAETLLRLALRHPGHC